MKNKIKMCFGIGAPSIIMIFICLSFTTLSILALMTASSNYKLARKHADYVQNYYSADTKIQEELSKLSKSLNEGQIIDQFVFTSDINEHQSIEIICDIKGKSFEILSQKIIVTAILNYDDNNKFDDRIVE